MESYTFMFYAIIRNYIKVNNTSDAAYWDVHKGISNNCELKCYIASILYVHVYGDWWCEMWVQKLWWIFANCNCNCNVKKVKSQVFFFFISLRQKSHHARVHPVSYVIYLQYAIPIGYQDDDEIYTIRLRM